VRKQWARDLRALQRARQARRQQGHKAGDGRDLVTTKELLERFGHAAGGGGSGDDGGSGGGGGMPAPAGGGTRSRLKGGLKGGRKGGRGDRSVGEVTGANATAAESKPRISKGKIKKVMRHWTSAGPAEAGG
jgi:hypothetical protein